MTDLETFNAAKARHNEAQLKVYELEQRQAHYEISQAELKLQLLAELKDSHTAMEAAIAALVKQ